MHYKGNDLIHDFYVVVGKQCCTIQKMRTRVTNMYNIIIYKLTNALLLFICLKLVTSYYLTKVRPQTTADFRGTISSSNLRPRTIKLVKKVKKIFLVCEKLKTSVKQIK